jgi:hypothetical protein
VHSLLVLDTKPLSNHGQKTSPLVGFKQAKIGSVAQLQDRGSCKLKVRNQIYNLCVVVCRERETKLRIKFNVCYWYAPRVGGSSEPVGDGL